MHFLYIEFYSLGAAAGVSKCSNYAIDNRYHHINAKLFIEVAIRNIVSMSGGNLQSGSSVSLDEKRKEFDCNNSSIT